MFLSSLNLESCIFYLWVHVKILYVLKISFFLFSWNYSFGLMWFICFRNIPKLSAWDYGALKQSETRRETDLWIFLRKLRQKILIIYIIFRKRCELVSTIPLLFQFVRCRKFKYQYVFIRISWTFYEIRWIGKLSARDHRASEILSDQILVSLESKGVILHASAIATKLSL